MRFKQRILIAVCGFAVTVVTANAQSSFTLAPHQPLLLRDQDHRCTRDGCGFLDIIDGAERGTSGFPDAG